MSGKFCTLQARLHLQYLRRRVVALAPTINELQQTMSQPDRMTLAPQIAAAQSTLGHRPDCAWRMAFEYVQRHPKRRQVTRA